MRSIHSQVDCSLLQKKVLRTLKAIIFRLDLIQPFFTLTVNTFNVLSNHHFASNRRSTDSREQRCVQNLYVYKTTKQNLTMFV